MTLSALVVDDEAPARKRLRDLIARASDVRLVGECEDGPSAVQAIEAQQPDLLFLDVQMPEMSGFDVLRSLDPDRLPVVVFVTAYDKHALEAFDARAIDYLLKPFTEDRFQDALERVRRWIDGGGAGADEARSGLSALLESGVGASDRIPVKSGDRIRFVPVSEIVRVEASGNYVELHTESAMHLVRGSLKSFAERLAPKGFVRVHNSHVVNWSCVEEMQSWGHGEFQLRLRGGGTVVSSRTYGADVRRLLEG